MSRFLKITVSLMIALALAYAYRGPLQALLVRLGGVYPPCEKSITYRIESFDARFGISEDYFSSALRDAEMIWEKPIGRELFTYTLEGDLKINLIYDYRQQATAKLQKLGLSMSNDQASYSALKAEYGVFKAAYALDRAAFEAKASDYETRQKAYEKELAYWNSRNGVPKDEYDRLNAERLALNAASSELNQSQVRLNDEIDSINAFVVVLNRLAVSLNLDASEFNTVGKTLGGEFEEGSYQSGPDGRQIDVYEFDNRAKLVRILAHEFGHALGLEHVDDPKAIMYRLNNGVNGELTATDLAALKIACGIK